MYTQHAQKYYINRNIFFQSNRSRLQFVTSGHYNKYLTLKINNNTLHYLIDIHAKLMFCVFFIRLLTILTTPIIYCKNSFRCIFRF